MSLPHLEWRYIGLTNFATSTVESVLDCIYLLGTANSYMDGTTRTQGSGSAWSFTGNIFTSGSSITEAIWCNPPSPFGTSQTILMAGSAVNLPNTAAVRSPDNGASIVTNTLYVNHSKGTGSVNWTAATPISGTTNFNYWKAWPTSAGVGNVYMWESKEVLAVIISTSTGTTYGFIAGAIIDPESVAALDAEADGRIYGILTSGATAINVAFNSTANDNIIQHGGTANLAHCGAYTPGTATVINLKAMTYTSAPVDTIVYRSRSGRLNRESLSFYNSTGPFNIVGRLRNANRCTDNRTGGKLISGTTVVGYYFGSSVNGDSDQLLLEHS